MDTPTPSGSARRWLVPAALLLLVLFSSAKTLPDLRHADEIGPYEQRFGGLRSLIPAGETVGFLTNVPTTEVTLWSREYFLAQYVLVPALVVAEEKEKRSLVVGDFYADQPPLDPRALDDLALVADLGEGVVLLRRVAR